MESDVKIILRKCAPDTTDKQLYKSQANFFSRSGLFYSSYFNINATSRRYMTSQTHILNMKPPAACYYNYHIDLWTFFLLSNCFLYVSLSHTLTTIDFIRFKTKQNNQISELFNRGHWQRRLIIANIRFMFICSPV